MTLTRAIDSSSRRCAHPTVLVVEDEAKFARIIAELLQRDGLASCVASTGDEALRLARDIHPDAVVLDVMIPHPDGIEVCRQLRRDGWDGPVVAMSASGSPSDRTRTLDAGADAFLSKPFPLDALRRTLASIDAGLFLGR